jgi:HlyD family type I secretion membrane fusion protein
MSRTRDSQHTVEIDPARRLAQLRAKTRRSVLVGTATILLFFGGFGAWSATAPLTSAAVAPGQVIVQGNRKRVEHLEGGIVKEILHPDGDFVEAGEPLVRLDDTRTRATYDMLQGQFRAALALEARLITERDGADKIDFPSALMEAARQDANVAQIVIAQNNVFKARRSTMEGQIKIMQQRVAQAREEIAGLEAQERSEAQQLALIGEELADVEQLVEKGLQRKTRLLALKRARAAIEGSRGEHVAEIARARQKIGEAKLIVLDLKNRRLNEVVDGLREAQESIADLTERVRAAEDILVRTTIRAPQSGVIVGSRVHTVGGVIEPGLPLMEIVPQDNKLIVETKVRPEDIDSVRTGLAAHVRLTGLNRRTTPSIDGEVVYVSADRLTDPETGIGYYRADVEVELASIDELGITLTPGMPAQVLIVTGERTAFNYLISPLADRFASALKEE